MTKQLEEIKRLAVDEKLAVEQRWHESEWNKFPSHTLAKHTLRLVELVDYLLVDETDPRVIEILEQK